MRGLLERRRVVQPRCVRLLAVRLLPVQRRCACSALRCKQVVVLLPFGRQCAGLLLEQQRVVQPRCDFRLLAVRLLPVQRRCALVRL